MKPGDKSVPTTLQTKSNTIQCIQLPQFHNFLTNYTPRLSRAAYRSLSDKKLAKQQ